MNKVMLRHFNIIYNIFRKKCLALFILNILSKKRQTKSFNINDYKISSMSSFEENVTKQNILIP